MRDKNGLIVKPVFTEEMKRDYTILIPDMLTFHFDLIVGVMKQHGYKMEVLKTNHKGIAEEGLRNVHNDTCYPALLVIGQLIDALKSGKYDLDKTALLMSQTGGGCRASNYISLLRKALEQNGFGHVPVLSLNFSGLEKEHSLPLGTKMVVKLVYAIMYADFIMGIVNQCIPYEVNKGQSLALVETWNRRLLDQMSGPGFVRLDRNYKAILADFSKIPLEKTEKVKVGIVGEIYLKYAPLGNNNLEAYLVFEGAEVVNSGLMDFLMYCVYNVINDKKLYGVGGVRYYVFKLALWYFTGRQRGMIKAIKKHGVFTPPADFASVIDMAKGYLDHGVKMGEGWLLTAEMLELIHAGVNNIVSAQPFGCLPNHIVAKGMIRKIKDNFPAANIVAVDYDPGASRINQENRIKLMLANAKQAAMSG
ncbi:MAG: 2-hydroxyacyl-CoA dehydratase [Oscillospiraceae bacterium]|nr:2-hydroxyacyl-CoA dehydratase [Oscillospiraceae bacterium]